MRKLLEELLVSVPDDGANAYRKKLYDSRYHDPKKPGKRVDRGIWEMVVVPSYLSGFIVSKERIQRFIDVALSNLGITDEIRNDEILSSAVYWEIRNIARRFYKTCESPQYGRKFFGITEKRIDYYILFKNYTQGILLKDTLRKDGIKTRISPAPRSIQEELGCGMTLLVMAEDIVAVRESIEKNHSEYYDIVPLECQIQFGRGKFC